MHKKNPPKNGGFLNAIYVYTYDFGITTASIA